VPCERAASQVRRRADRTGGVHDELYLAGETDLGAILTHVEQVRPEVLVVDSTPHICSARAGGVPAEPSPAPETDLGAILTHVEQVRPEVLVVDSIQTIGAASLDGVPGGVTQVKEVAAALIRVAKTRNITTIIVGHVTKDGSLAGPRVLEHVVDVVLHFEGDRDSRFRMVRALKNRFGPVDEVGCIALWGEGRTAGV